MEEMFNILEWSVDHMVLSIKWQRYSIGKPVAQEMSNASFHADNTTILN